MCNRVFRAYVRGICLAVLLAGLVCGLLVPDARAAGEELPKAVKDAPQPVPDRSTAVSVEHDGADMAGTRLVFHLKELVNTSSLFSLTEADNPKITLLISSASEFPSRPEVGSAYAVVWVYSENKGNLPYYLGRETGVVSEATALELARRLAERTDGIAVKYSYLFGR